MMAALTCSVQVGSKSKLWQTSFGLAQTTKIFTTKTTVTRWNWYNPLYYSYCQYLSRQILPLLDHILSLGWQMAEWVAHIVALFKAKILHPIWFSANAAPKNLIIGLADGRVGGLYRSSVQGQNFAPQLIFSFSQCRAQNFSTPNAYNHGPWPPHRQLRRPETMFHPKPQPTQQFKQLAIACRFMWFIHFLFGDGDQLILPPRRYYVVVAVVNQHSVCRGTRFWAA